MSLTFAFDATLRLMLEAGFTQYFSAPLAGQEALPADANSARMAWNDPEFGTLMCKPLQLQDDFLNHPAQLSSGAVLRLGTDLMANPADITSHLVFEANVGTVSNPWVFFSPATSYLASPTLTPAGVAPSYNLTPIAAQTETGMGGTFEVSPGAALPRARSRKKKPAATPFPGVGPLQDMRQIVDTKSRFPANQGFYFRWYFPFFQHGIHQTLFAFTFGQYLALCRGTLMEVYRDVSPSGDKSNWLLIAKKQMFAATSHTELKINSDYNFGLQAPSSVGHPTGGDCSLLILPFRRNRVLLLSNFGQRLVLTAYNKPQMLPDGSDWDITRSDAVQVWALTPIAGRFQLQKLLYEPGPVTLQFPYVIVDYTPVTNPEIIIEQDVFHGESVMHTLQFPALYTFPTDPASNDVPPPTTAGSAQTRIYGLTLTYSASGDQGFSPQFYGLQVQAVPVFQDNPNTPVTITDMAGASNILAAETSLGINPGEGHATVQIFDYASYSLEPFYYRSEMPLQLLQNGTPIFTGYSDRIEVQPLRQTLLPRKLMVRGTDRWLLLQEAFLRSQRDYTNFGHITVVDFIARQCGIDTGTLHADGTFREDGSPNMSGGANAEYPAGWDGAMSSFYNTPLGLPFYDANNLTGEQQLGWMPQPEDTGASFLKRIAENFSGWILGFRSTGKFFYLPYDYFKTPTVMFKAHHGGVAAGLMQTAGAGLSVSISGGSFIPAGGGGAMTVGSQIVGGLTDNALNSLYLGQNGVATSNTTGIPPSGAISLGTATTSAGAVVLVDTTATSTRQTSTSPVFRSPVEHRTIEPSGNVVQVRSFYGVDYTAQYSGLWIDWASVKGTPGNQPPNYLGRYKWFVYQINGAFSPAQLNSMAYIVFQRARRRRKRVTFSGDYQPGLEIGHVFNLEGIGNYRMLSMRARFIRNQWDVAEYEGEAVERGY